jgi:hypothetical protein
LIKLLKIVGPESSQGSIAMEQDLFENFDFKSPTVIIAVLVVFATIVLIVITKKAKKSYSIVDPDRLVLEKIYKTAGGSNWDIKYSENWLKSDAPIGTWAGIEGGFANGKEHVMEFIMRGNRQFIGTL